MLVQGSVFVALADTLAAHAIGGFKSGVGSALRKCRDCMATAEAMTSKGMIAYTMTFSSALHALVSCDPIFVRDISLTLLFSCTSHIFSSCFISLISLKKRTSS